MLPKFIFSLFIFFCLLCLSGKVQCSPSPEGTHFVFSFPHKSTEGPSKARLVAVVPSPKKHYLIRVHVKLSHDRENYTYTVTEPYPLNLNIPYKRKTNSSVAINDVCIIKSSRPIRVFVVTGYVDENTRFDAFFMVMPIESCYNTYYITHPPGYPFVEVLTFNHSYTRLNIKFPENHERPFNKTCFGDKICQQGKQVEIKLRRYQSWYFGLDDPLGSLQNMLIVATNPIYVIAGSTRCKLLSDSLLAQHDNSVCTHPMRPRDSWGNTHVVFGFTEHRFRFNVEVFPLPLSVYVNDGERFDLTIPQGFFGTIRPGNSSFILTSSIRFCVYVIVPYCKSVGGVETGTTILGLIPVEQWANKINYSYFPVTRNYQSYFRLITAYISTKDLNFKGDFSRSPAVLTWNHKKSVTVENNFLFGWGEVDLKGVNQVEIVSKNPKAKMMLYICGFESFKNFSSSKVCYPYFFFQSPINGPWCLKTEDMSPSDGIDNDCDGKIDEEVENKRDDDGDERIDEDLVESVLDGEWGNWHDIDCQVNVSGLAVRISVRNCLGHEGHGKFCVGDDIACNDGPCPFIPAPNRNNSEECLCGFCSRCSNDIFHCDGCASGFLPTKHCIQPCPSNWDGVACMRYIDTSVVRRPSKITVFLFLAFICTLIGVSWKAGRN